MQPRPPKQARLERVVAAVNHAEREAITSTATALGITVSELIREATFHVVRKHLRAQQAEAKP